MNKLIFSMIITVILFIPLHLNAQPFDRLSEAQAATKKNDTKKLAQLAYEYAYSIDKAYQYFYKTVIEKDSPLNRFQNIRKLADDTYTAHPSINNDTLHIMGWMDLAAEPVIITIPDHDKGRYWLFHTMNLQHFTDSAFGSPTRGSKGGIFMYAVEGWQGKVPSTVDEVIYVEHPLVKMMGRVMSTGGKDSVIAVKLQDHWSIRTLSAFLGQTGPKPVKRNYPDIDKSNWLERTNFILSEGTMRDHDSKLLKNFLQLGLGAPIGTKLSNEQLKMAQQAKKSGEDHIKNAPFTDSRDVLGTREDMTAVPSYQHAFGTMLGQWGLPAAQTMYVAGFVDRDNKPLDGNKYDYEVTFDGPQVDGFWSYTVYNAENKFMTKNDLNRHSRGDRTLKANKDGSYTIHMSTDTKGKENEPNFLPIPDTNWYYIIRMYTPGDDVRNDVWKETRFTRVKK